MGSRVAVVGAVTLALLALAAPASGAGSVDIKVEGFDPAVVVVPPGSRVTWTNRSPGARQLAGDFDSPRIAPGATFKRRFPHLGVFAYHDRDNPLLTGTVIVGAAGRRGPRYPAPRGPRVVTHVWRATLHFEVRESWSYMDGKFLSLEGPCNAEVGTGSREVTFQAKFPRVRYSRVGKLEVLSGTSKPYGIQRYRERIDAKTSDPSGGRIVDCGDGSVDPPPDVEQRCDHNYAGTRVRGELLWSPRVAHGRFQWPHDYLSRPPAEGNCGHSFLAGTLVGLNPDLLPWDPGAGAELLYDHGRTGPATRAETKALRGGRPVRVRRQFELHFTVDCCVGWNEPDKPGTYVRAGARHTAKGTVTIRFEPLSVRRR